MAGGLPASFSKWPPPAVVDIYEDIKKWSAWWSADTNELQAVYGGASPTTQTTHPAQFSGGLKGRVARMFWGTPQSPQQQSPKLHVPLASDIVNTAADLLFGDRPSFVIGDPQERSKRIAPGTPKRAFDEDAGTMMPNPKAYQTKGRQAAEGTPTKGGGSGEGKRPPNRAPAGATDPSTKPANAPGGPRADDPNAPPGSDPEQTAEDFTPETPEDPAQQRLDELFGKKTMSQLQSAARVQSGLGGVYLRVVWDEEVADYPIVDVIHPDAAIPTFKWDHLTEVTFWRELHNDKGEVWRHLERHYTETAPKLENPDGSKVLPRDRDSSPDAKITWKTDRKTGQKQEPQFNPDTGLDEGGKPELEKIGWIEHAVYTGDTTTIGLRRTWDSMSEWPREVMEAMQPHLDLMMDMIARLPDDDPEMPGGPDMSQFGSYRTGLSMLDCVFVPGAENVTRRNDATARRCGQADYALVVPLMDSLDEIYTSWMRDIRLARARIFVPQEYLDNLGPGKGAVFNNDQEVYVPVDTLAGSAAEANLAIQMFQPEIRFEAHERSSLAVAAQAISKSGYSEQTFGLTGEVAMTATESNARERKTAQTIAGKEGVWQVALPQLCKIMMAVDEMVFSGMEVDDDITVEFAPFASDGPVEQSQTISTLMTAKAMSQRTAVRTLHPDWDDDQVDAELLEIDSAEPEPPLDPLGLEREMADAKLKDMEDKPPPPNGSSS